MMLATGDPDPRASLLALPLPLWGLEASGLGYACTLGSPPDFCIVRLALHRDNLSHSVRGRVPSQCGLSYSHCYRVHPGRDKS